MNPTSETRYAIRLPDGRYLGRYTIHGEIVPVPPVLAHTFADLAELVPLSECPVLIATETVRHEFEVPASMPEDEVTLKRFEGVGIMATNLFGNYEEALLRRVQRHKKVRFRP